MLKAVLLLGSGFLIGIILYDRMSLTAPGDDSGGQQQAFFSTPLQRLHAALSEGDLKAASELYRRHCRETPQCVNLWVKAVSQKQSSNPRFSGEALRQLLRLEPGNPIALYHLAQYYAATGELRPALTLLLELRLRPQDSYSPEQLTRAIDELAGQHLKTLREDKNETDALSFITFLVNEDNSNLYWRYQHGVQLFRLGRLIDALETLDQIIYDPRLGTRAERLIAEIKRSFKPLEVAEPEPAEPERTRLVRRKLKDFNNGYRIPLERQGRHFIVNCNIDGNRNIRLIIDTGATLTAIKEQLLHSLGLGQGIVGLVTLNTAGGTISAPLTRVGEFSIAGQTVRNMQVALMTLENFQGFDGLLGMNYLQHFDFYIDQQEPALFLAWR